MISLSYLLFTLLLGLWAEYERDMKGAKKYSNGHVWYYRVRQGRQFWGMADDLRSAHGVGSAD